MIVRGDARQRGARLALAAGAERHHLVGRQVAVDVDGSKFLDAVEIAGLARDLSDPFHGAADQHDLAVAGRRRLGDRTHARHVRSEGRDGDAARRGLESVRRG